MPEPTSNINSSLTNNQIPQSTLTRDQVSEVAGKVNNFINHYELTMQNLLIEYKTQTDSISDDHDKKIQTHRTEHQETLNSIQGKLRSKTNETNKNIANINQSFEKLEKAAKAHLNQQKVSLPGQVREISSSQAISLETSSPNTSNNPAEQTSSQSYAPSMMPNTLVSASSNPLEEAEENLASGKKILQNLEKAEMPKNLVNIVIASLIGALLIGVCSALNGGNFFLAFLVLSGLGGSIALLIYQSAVSSMRGLYSALMQQKVLAEQKIEVNFYQHQLFITQCETESKNSAAKFQQTETQLSTDHEKTTSSLDADFQWKIAGIIEQTQKETQILQSECQRTFKEARFAAVEWKEDFWQKWQPFNSFCSAVSAGIITISSSYYDITEDIGKNYLERLNLETKFNDLYLSFDLPAMMSVSNGRGLLFCTVGDEKAVVLDTVRSVMLRLLANQPPGTVRFTMLDPIAQGGNFGAFMPLKKYDEKLIASRVWSEPNHIEEQLSRITERMSEIIQMRLRNEHNSIEEYNRKAKVPEPYEFVIVADFPANFNDTAARRLVSIAQNGPRCGIYPIIVVDKNIKLPHNFDLQALAQFTETIDYQNESYNSPNESYDRWKFDFSSQQLDLANEKEKTLVNKIIEEIGKKATEAMKVEVPFDELLEMDGLSEENFWTGSTADKIEVPLGPHNVEDSQKLVFGKGTAHHAVVIGKTGSGKTNLMDVIITTLALKYSPQEIQFYLVDLKKGVGFKPYADAQLPHARVIAIDSEREFALSVLRGLVDEMDKRGDEFRLNSVDNLKSFREKNPDVKMPRILLVVDEFQNLFLEDDSIGRESAMILDRLVREGRGFGVHVLLGSQSLAGKASNISGSTLGQIGVRIALMCNESDARQIMADDNAEAKYLSRPGEAIYNDRNGLIEGNKRFQVALFKNDVRQKYLRILAAKADASDEKPIVFEGNQLARFEDCTLFRKFLSGETEPNAKRVEAWIGEPIALRDSTAIRFRKQGGNNLLVVAKDENEGVGILTSAWLSLAAQHHPNTADFFALNLTNAEEPWHELIEEVGTMIPHKTHTFGRRGMLGVLQTLETEIKVRAEDSKGDGKAKYLLLFGLQRAKDLRVEDGFSSHFSYSDDAKEPNAAEIFTKILREGAEVGVHVLVWCDLAGNAKKTLDRKAMNEFGFRCATAMSQDDSQFVLDSAAASKLDRPHRAVFYDEDRPGHLEKFRPFAVPADKKWLQQTTADLCAFHTKSQAA